MDQEQSENSSFQNDISPVTKMKVNLAEKTKIDSQYWIDHFKYKQSLINQLEILKNEKPEKSIKTSQISSFTREQEILCDNLYKLNQITNYSQLKLGKNFNKMKTIENNEEILKKKLNEIFENNLEKIRTIEKTKGDIDIQKNLLNSWFEIIEKMKNDISSTRRENCINIDVLCNQYSQNDKEFKKITKLYNLMCNITKYRILNIQNDENDQQTQVAKGYLLNSKNGNILSYNIKINNESVENKAIKVFNFWKTLIELNKKDTKKE
jgi:hypothetical protein